VIISLLCGEGAEALARDDTGRNPRAPAQGYAEEYDSIPKSEGPFGDLAPTFDVSYVSQVFLSPPIPALPRGATGQSDQAELHLTFF
jgi:hypothetical protein